MPGSIHSQDPREQDQSMVDATPATIDPILLDEKRIVVVRYNSRKPQGFQFGVDLKKKTNFLRF